jgi:hypothetical protein
MIQWYFYTFDVMLFYISLPSWPNNNNTLSITVAHERFSVLRVDDGGQMSGQPMTCTFKYTSHNSISQKSLYREILCTEASITAGLNI